MKLWTMCIAQLISLSAVAQVYSSSISKSTGGTGRAAVEASDAMYLNAATLVHLRGSYLNAALTEKEYGVSISDNSPQSMMPAALGFLHKKRDVSQGELIEQDVLLSLADFFVDKWSLGVTGHYFTQTLNGASYRKTDADIGIMYTPKSNIGLGLVVYNVFGENKAAPANIRQKTSIAGGFNYIYEARIRFRLDASSESVFMGGIESYLNDFMILRIGYSTDTDDSRDLGSLGLGFKGPRFAMNYAYQGNPQNSADYLHSVDLEIPF